MSERDWGCDRKVMSRKACVVDFWRKRNGTKSIPPGLYYWSMCAANVSNGEVIEWHEYDHLVNKEKFISPEQWVGVDTFEDQYLENLSLGMGRWILKDFRMAMLEAEYRGDFSPAYVNLDTQWQPKKAVAYMADVMPILSRQSQEVILATNILVDHRFYMKNAEGPDKVSRLLEAEPSYLSALKSAKWEFPAWVGNEVWGHYEYDGTDSSEGRSASTFATFIAIKLAR